jgi:hypothetical protein
MSLSTQAFTAFVWTDDDSRPSGRLTVVAWDEADAHDQVIALLGAGTRCAVWVEPDIRRIYAPRGYVNTRLREHRCLVWSDDPEAVGERLTVWARGAQDARRLLKALRGEGIFMWIDDVEDVERTRRRTGGATPPSV